MATSLYPQEKAFNDVAGFVKFSIKLMQCSRIGFVGNTNCAALHPDKIPNMSRTKSFVAQNRFAIKVYFIQKLNGAFRIMNVSASEQQSDELKVFSDKSMNFGGLAAARHSDCLIAIFFTSPGCVLMHLAEG